jgi:hypothetical protein
LSLRRADSKIKKENRMDQNRTQAKPDEVLREFHAIGKYRVRVIKAKSGTALDIREYISGEGGFEGFTRRGVRLSDRAQLESLCKILTEVLDDGQF